MLLELDNISVNYGGIEALTGVSLTVDKGEIVALIGAKGAGKSTTLRTISGLVRARKGRVIFDGRDITRSSPGKVVATGIGHVPEGRGVFATMSVQENLEMGAYATKGGRETREVMDRVFARFPRLLERRSRSAGTLSGGERQMLAIGRALMSRPRLLLMDEPSMGLAPMLVREIFSIVRELNEQGTAVLLVEQNAHLALSVARRAYLLETGQVTLSGPADELAGDPDVRRACLGA